MRTLTTCTYYHKGCCFSILNGLLNPHTSITKHYKKGTNPPPPHPTSHTHQLYGVTSGYTRLIMKTKHACHGLISLLVKFHKNLTMRTLFLHVKNRKWGGGRKRVQNSLKFKCVFFPASPT